MRRVLALTLSAALLGAALGCAPRQVEVSTGPQPATTAAAAIDFRNNLSRAVNVYVVTGAGGDMFLRQVPANGRDVLPVRGIAPGASVTLRAVTVDGQQRYSRDNVVLGSSTEWQVP